MSNLCTWTDEEVEIMRTEYPKRAADNMKDLLPGKTPQQIRSKASKMALSLTEKARNNARSRSRSSFMKMPLDERRKFIKRHYPGNGPEYCAEKIGCSRKYAISMACQLGVKLTPEAGLRLRHAAAIKSQKNRSKESYHAKAVGTWNYCITTGGTRRPDFNELEQLAICAKW